MSENFCAESNCTNEPEEGKDYCSSHLDNCAFCKKEVNVDDWQLSPSHEHLCEECYNETYTSCPNCSKTVEQNEILSPTLRNRHGYLKEGGCTDCCYQCYVCNKVIDKEEGSYVEDGDPYCEDCFSEHFSFCSNCNETTTKDDTHYSEIDNDDYCSSCWNDKYDRCTSCDKEVEKSECPEVNNKYYCDSCYKSQIADKYKEFTNFESFSFTKKDKYLNKLKKLTPISIKDFKTNYAVMAAGLSDLFKFCNGKIITDQIIEEYRASLNPEIFPVEYTSWDGIQRSISTTENEQAKYPQLVMNILASDEMIQKLRFMPVAYAIFDGINTLSKTSTHPYVKDQIGWARLEIDPKKEFVLIDELQFDHSSAINLFINHSNPDINKIIEDVFKKFKLPFIEEKITTDSGIVREITRPNVKDLEYLKAVEIYKQITKEFTSIGMKAIMNFAKTNGFKKVFWHTYEGGKKLKQNDPPKSMYDKVPKEHFFAPSTEKPFGMEADFFEREASVNNLYKIARKFTLKLFSV